MFIVVIDFQDSVFESFSFQSLHATREGAHARAVQLAAQHGGAVEVDGVWRTPRVTVAVKATTVEG